MNFLSTLLLSTLITISLIPISRWIAIRLNVMDMPNQRKVHTKPIPRIGGLAMAFGAFAPFLFVADWDPFVKALCMSTAVIVAFGMLDDAKGLNFKQKLAAQTAASLIMILYGGVRITSLGMLLPDDMILPIWIAIPLTLFIMVGVINAINLSDGLDGLAGGICLLSFACIGYLAYGSGDMTIAVVAFAMAGCILGFLRFNTFPATLFMGDAGSQFLGLIAAALSIKLAQGNTALSRILPLILLGFPILDTLSVMMERITQGRSPFLPDKNHFHHKLIRLGLYHTESVIAIYILQAALVVSAYIFRFYPEGTLLLAYMIFSGVILALFQAAERTGWHFKRTSLIDTAVKGRLRFLKEKNLLIVFSFRLLQIALPALMFATCFLVSDLPAYLPFFTLAAAVILLFTLIFFKNWLGSALRVVLYLVIPFVVFFSSENRIDWTGLAVEYIYHISFGVVVVLAILTLKFTRRTSGFKATPMDVLILFFALVVPNIPDFGINQYNMGMVAAKIVVFFFSYDVVMGEQRGKHKWLCIDTIGAFSIVSIKGFCGL
jgi:UDP-GlcNAc:undecaprenyl-phosphate GlcNAc-1-phosphate transferase